MSYVTGTATDYNDFFTKLVAFLTTNATLVTDGQNWEQVWANGDGSEIVLKGPGLDGLASVFVGVSKHFNVGADSFYILFHGMTDIVDSATSISGHINVSPYGAGIYTDSNPQTYWFIANGRRFIVINKISTVYQQAYAGLFLPYALPTTYPYPMMIGGSRQSVVPSTQNWRSVYTSHTGLAWPSMATNLVDTASDTPTMMFLDPLGTWVPVVNQGNIDQRHGVMLPLYAGITSLQGIDAPNLFQSDGQFLGYNTANAITKPSLGGSYPLTPLTIAVPPQSRTTPPFENEMIGVLDGAYFVPGFGNASENTVTIDALAHLVVQNAFRTGNNDYIAVALG